jgi:hypothetical protein
MIINRRSLITGLVSFIAAPAIVRVANLMPINSSLVDDFPIAWGPGYFLRGQAAADFIIRIDGDLFITASRGDPHPGAQLQDYLDKYKKQDP